jgi:hypothetical protein
MDDIALKIHGGTEFDLKENFERLAKAWRRDTEFFSSLFDIVMDHSYQKIIGLGAPAVPLIMQELQKKPGHWHWALYSITQTNAAEEAPDGDIKAICNAWLKWGAQKDLLQ